MKKSILVLAITIFSFSLYSQVDTISTNIYQNGGKLGIGTEYPSSNLSILKFESYQSYDKLLDLRLEGADDSYIQFRNNTSLDNKFEPCIHSFTSFSERSGMAIMGGVTEEGDISDLPIIFITPYVDNGSGWEHGGYDYPTNRHYFSISGYKSGVGRKYLFEIDQQGFVGIGTKTPYAKLEVKDGDIYISDIEKGIIMKSPDGQCWRGTVDNTGSLNFVQITCPEDSVVVSEITNGTPEVSIYPNPTGDNVTVNIENMKSGKMKYFVVDINGKVLQKGKVRSNEQVIELSTYNSGIYMITIVDNKGNKVVSERVIKK